MVGTHPHQSQSQTDVSGRALQRDSGCVHALYQIEKLKVYYSSFMVIGWHMCWVNTTFLCRINVCNKITLSLSIVLEQV